MTLPAHISALLKAPASANADTLTEIEDRLSALPELHRFGHSVHCFHGYQIRTGLMAHLIREEQALRRVEPLGLAIAPVVVQRVELAPAEGALVMHYLACATGKLQPVEGPVSQKAREGFMNDMHALIDAGLTHSYAPRGRDHWLVASDTGSIVLTGWGSALRPLEIGETEEIFAKLNLRLQ